ncbi:kinase-like domain-containing protein, partial [Tanacetum coccineum]
MSCCDPVKFSYKEIASITRDFNDVVEEDVLGKVYKATLSQSGESVNVVVRRVDHSYWMQDFAYDKEVRMLSTLKHKNLVSLVGYCKDNNEMFVVNKDEARGSLYKYLNDPIKLTWMRRLKISVGVASALNYMHDHEGRNYSVMHRNVNSDTILIDENWEAKLS